MDCIERKVAIDWFMPYLHTGEQIPAETVIDGLHSLPAALPVGRCMECGHWYKGHCTTGPCAAEKTDEDFYCRCFKPKKGEGDA